MLFFRWNDMVHDIQKLQHCDLEPVFLHHLANEGMLECFIELDTAAGEFPFAGFVSCFLAASGQEDLSLVS